MSEAIRIRVESQPGVAVLHLAGHLGFDGLRELKAACDGCLANPGVAEVRLDLDAIETGDATAIGLLLVLRERGHAQRKRVSLTRPPARSVPGLDPDRVCGLFGIPPSPGTRSGP